MPLSARTREQLQTGVYCWLNNVNGKVYIGSTSRVTFPKRRSMHLSTLRNGKSQHRHLQSAWNKYGEDAFEWIVLWRCLPTECLDWEQWWMDRLQAANPEYGYNGRPVAESCLGFKHSSESSARHADANRRRASNPEWVAKQARAISRTKSTPEARAKQSALSKKQHADPVIGPKMRAAATIGVAKPESRAKISEVARKRRRNEQGTFSI